MSTKGMGGLANKARHKAQCILRQHKASVKATGCKSNVPVIKFKSCPIIIEEAEKTKFDYWVSFECSFSKQRTRIPANGHKRLEHFIKSGWNLNPTGELVLQKNGRWQARVYLQKEKQKALYREKHLGIDVGITHSVSRSDGYLGKGLSKLIKRVREKDAERRRQGHVLKRPKSSVKQHLDVEARRAVTRCKRDGLSLAVENPKILANLRSGSLQGWARSYFAHRAACIAEEEGIWITRVNPTYTSQTCFKCGNRDKLSRVKLVFNCTACGSRTHADINAARVIALGVRDSESDIQVKTG